MHLCYILGWSNITLHHMGKKTNKLLDHPNTFFWQIHNSYKYIYIYIVMNLQLFLILLHKLCEPYDLFTFVNLVSQAHSWEGRCCKWVANSNQERTFSLEAQNNNMEQSTRSTPRALGRTTDWKFQPRGLAALTSGGNKDPVLEAIWCLEPKIISQFENGLI